ncbi:hypothetical protein CKO50_01200 [Pseudoalteromonas sp. HM-SA03]|nr:hypothetical protein CKO50_01200 [Pseudoalteromonas sp. HM-SA03]
MFLDKLKQTKPILKYAVAFIGLIGTLIGILQYYESKPSDDLTGQWKLTLTIDSTSYRPYQGLEVGYSLYLNQVGSQVTGTGEKI